MLQPILSIGLFSHSPILHYFMEVSLNLVEILGNFRFWIFHQRNRQLNWFGCAHLLLCSFYGLLMVLRWQSEQELLIKELDRQLLIGSPIHCHIVLLLLLLGHHDYGYCRIWRLYRIECLWSIEFNSNDVWG